MKVGNGLPRHIPSEMPQISPSPADPVPGTSGSTDLVLLPREHHQTSRTCPQRELKSSLEKKGLETEQSRMLFAWAGTHEGIARHQRDTRQPDEVWWL